MVGSIRSATIRYQPLPFSGTCPGKKKFTRRCCSPSDSCLARCQAPNSIGSLKHAKLGHCQIMWLLCSETEVLSCSMKDERLQAPVPTCSCSWSSCNGMVWWHPCTAPREPHHNLPPIPNQLQQVRWLEKSVWTNSIYLLIYLCRHWTSTGNHAESQQFYSQKSERAHSKACLPNIDLLLGCILFLIFKPIQKSPHRSQLNHSAPQPACQSATADSCGTVNRRHPCRPGTRCSAAARSTCHHRSTTKSWH